jgi:hypothetical protein
LSNSRDPSRGNVRDREARRAWLLREFGDGKRAPCALRISAAYLKIVTELTITVDRIIPGRLGGRYVRGNIRPACRPCQDEQGGRSRKGEEQHGAITGTR